MKLIGKKKKIAFPAFAELFQRFLLAPFALIGNFLMALLKRHFFANKKELANWLAFLICTKYLNAVKMEKNI